MQINIIINDDNVSEIACAFGYPVEIIQNPQVTEAEYIQTVIEAHLKHGLQSYRAHEAANVELTKEVTL